MKKKVTFEKSIEFPTMIGEICEISLDQELKFTNESNVEGDLLLTGKYKMTEASRLEEDFSYKIPTEIALTEKVDLNTTNIEISDFYYEIENENILICHIELTIEGLELLEEDNIVLERECDGDDMVTKEIEIPVLETKEEIIEDDKKEIDSTEPINSLFSNLDDEKDRYGTFIVYMVRNDETVNSIIEKYHTTIEELEKYNDLKEINLGTKLIIPLINE
ncbi:MAG: LysM peptidoglycan-binding domain-containing protein [Bacilli bacterium]|nr:LysM peptidoglycan-binding domain-containing protein [Bacilli bacterium]